MDATPGTASRQASRLARRSRHRHRLPRQLRSAAHAQRATGRDSAAAAPPFSAAQTMRRTRSPRAIQAILPRPQPTPRPQGTRLAARPRGPPAQGAAWTTREGTALPAPTPERHSSSGPTTCSSLSPTVPPATNVDLRQSYAAAPALPSAGPPPPFPSLLRREGLAQAREHCRCAANATQTAPWRPAVVAVTRASRHTTLLPRRQSRTTNHHRLYDVPAPPLAHRASRGQRK